MDIADSAFRLFKKSVPLCFPARHFAYQTHARFPEKSLFSCVSYSSIQRLVDEHSLYP